MQKVVHTIESLPFTPEIQTKLNGEGATIITFSNHTIMKYLVPSDKNDCNVVSFDIGRAITTKDFEDINSYDIDLTSIYLNGTVYGFDIFNLSRKELCAEDFIKVSNQISEVLLNILHQDIKVYLSKNHMFKDGFTVP